MLGLIPTQLRLFGIDPLPQAIGAQGYFARVYLLGADNAGRDIFSRICYGSRISMTIGLLGVALVLVIGLAVGGDGLLRRTRRRSALQRKPDGDAPPRLLSAADVAFRLPRQHGFAGKSTSRSS